jgi:hypothetical protein
MPAALPGSTPAQNAANPSLGAAVLFDALSGPKGSPFDKDMSGNASTGALQTGIGFGQSMLLQSDQIVPGMGNFDDDCEVGVDKPDLTASTNSTLCYIGGGRSNANSGGSAAPNPYTAGFGLCGAGNGGSRDGGAGPAFTGFHIKTVTATGTVANGAVVETGWVNRSGVSLVAGQSVFGSAATQVAAPTVFELPEAP